MTLRGGVISKRTSENSVKEKFGEIVKDELLRIHLPRTPVNNGAKKGRAFRPGLEAG